LGGRSKAARNRSRSRSVIFSDTPPFDCLPFVFLALKGFAVFFALRSPNRRHDAAQTIPPYSVQRPNLRRQPCDNSPLVTGRIVDRKKGDCASKELSQLLMYMRVDLYSIKAVPIRDLIYIPTSANKGFRFR